MSIESNAPNLPCSSFESRFIGEERNVYSKSGSSQQKAPAVRYVYENTPRA